MEANTDDDDNEEDEEAQGEREDEEILLADDTYKEHKLEYTDLINSREPATVVSHS
jgi:hypothetical protein